MSSYNMKKIKLALVLLDLVGSTAYVQKVGASVAARVFQHHDRLARSVCYRCNGREIDRSDGFLMSFESVQDAVLFSILYNQNVTARIKLRARIGIHWGEVIEVIQHAVYVEAGAKRVELEGLSKNIAARTMSIAFPSQILLTEDAYRALKQTTSLKLPSDIRTACVGLYQFKGVVEPVTVYAINSEHRLLQPPPGNAKVKRLGGPKYIKKLARDRKLADYFKVGINVTLIFGYFIVPIASYFLLKSRALLEFLGIYDEVFWLHIVALWIEGFFK